MNVMKYNFSFFSYSVFCILFSILRGVRLSTFFLHIFFQMRLRNVCFVCLVWGKWAQKAVSLSHVMMSPAESPLVRASHTLSGPAWPTSAQVNTSGLLLMSARREQRQRYEMSPPAAGGRGQRSLFLTHLLAPPIYWPHLHHHLQQFLAGKQTV